VFSGGVVCLDRRDPKTLNPNISAHHLKVFVADLGPKYNVDLMEAFNNLGVVGAPPEVTPPPPPFPILMTLD